MCKKENKLKLLIDNIGGNLEAQCKIDDKKYYGHLSIVGYLINYYFIKFYNTGECEYILNIKANRLCVELLKWLASNYNKNTQGILNSWFKNKLKIIDDDLYEFKEKLYNMWKGGEFYKLLFKLNRKEFLDERELLLLQFVRRYKCYNEEKETQIKLELGLK